MRLPWGVIWLTLLLHLRRRGHPDSSPRMLGSAQTSLHLLELHIIFIFSPEKKTFISRSLAAEEEE